MIADRMLRRESDAPLIDLLSGAHGGRSLVALRGAEYIGFEPARLRDPLARGCFCRAARRL
jgi:hypothetical protein